MIVESPKENGKDKRVHTRKHFCKSGLIIFDGEPQMMIETLNISVSGVGIISQTHPSIKSSCWIRLRIPKTHEKSQIFDVKATVAHSIFCNEKDGFKVGLLFSNPSSEMVKLINQIK